MDATQGTSVELLNELHMWLHCCDICIRVATNPIATTCGHFFCRSCLNEAFQGQQARPCPICRVDLLEETVQSIPINRDRALAEPTPEVANSEIPISNARSRGPTTRTPITARSNLISFARMDVVQEYLEEESEYLDNIQLTLSRRLSDLQGERIRDLEQVVQNLMQMNVDVFRAREAYLSNMRRLSRRIEELENPTVHGANAFARRQ